MGWALNNESDDFDDDRGDNQVWDGREGVWMINGMGAK